MAKHSLTSNFDTELIQLPETAGTGHASTAHAMSMPVVHGEAHYQNKQSYGVKLMS